jgi:hypothetical protein
MEAVSDRYEGDFVGGKREGKGSYTYSGGSLYEGEWVKGIRTGPDGDRCEGD